MGCGNAHAVRFDHGQDATKVGRVGFEQRFSNQRFIYGHGKWIGGIRPNV
jgi:hypothetical protein